MSDEEDETFSPEEGFSASEDEWKPTKEMQKGGESSDDDDSDFDDLPILSGVGSNPGSAAAGKRREPKGRSATKQQAVKKRKSTGQSLRSKLYNKYKPPPKTFPTRSDSNSPSASTSSKNQKKASKNSKTPNDGSDNDDNSSSDSSVDDYLVNPAELDLRSSFFDVGNKKAAAAADDAPQFDCNAGINLTDSDSEDNETSGDNEKPTTTGRAFDFRNLLEKATSLERAKETIAKRTAARNVIEEKRKSQHDATAMDVESLLALGENQVANSEALDTADDARGGRQKLRQTKSTRQKRHTKTRPASTVIAAAGDSEDSDWEDVADDNSDAAEGALKQNTSGNLEIHVELPNRQRQKKSRDQQDLENALKRKINRDIKDRQMLLHKASLLVFFARSYSYNRLLNDTALMQDALKLLPSKNAYPSEHGTELKYYQSLVTWFKTTIKLKSEALYAEKNPKSKDKIKQQFIEQFKKKEARCKQDMVCMFVILVRGMGLQCRLVVNMQPLPLRPSQSDLCTIKLKKDDKEEDKKSTKLVEKDTDKNKKHIDQSKGKEKAKKTIERKDNSNKNKEKDNTDESESREKAKKTTERKDNINKSKEKDNRDESESRDKAKKAMEQKADSNKNNERDIKDESESRGKAKKAAERKDNSNKSKEKDKAKKSTEHEDNLDENKEKAKNKDNSNKSDDNNESFNKNNKKDNKDRIVESTKLGALKLKGNVNELGETNTIETTKMDVDEKINKPAEIPKEIPLKQEKGTEKLNIKTDSSENVTVKQENATLTPLKDIDDNDIKETVLKHTTKPALIKLKRNQNVEQTVERKKSKLVDAVEAPMARRTRLQSRDKSPQQTAAQKPTTSKSTKSATAIDQLQNKEVTEKPKSIIEIVINSDNAIANATEQQQNLEPNEKAAADTKKSKQNARNTAVFAKQPVVTKTIRDKRSSSISPKSYVSTNFLKANKVFKEKFSNNIEEQQKKAEQQRARSKSPKDKNEKVKISTEFLKEPPTQTTRVLRSRQKSPNQDTNKLQIPQLDGADDVVDPDDIPLKDRRRRLPKLKKLQKSRSKDDSSEEEHFQPTPPKRPKAAPVLPKAVAKLRKDRRVLSTDDETLNANAKSKLQNANAADMWVEVWSDVEEQWICVDLFKGKLHSVDAIRRAASSSFAYVYAFQNDLSIKDITARYCPNWTTTIRKSRVEKAWLDEAISGYLGRRTKRDIREDQELRRIHEEKPMPTAISEYKDHPLYALERHLLKFQAIYPPEPPTLGFVRGEPVYARECVHTLHSREIWLKQARTVKLGEQPYKIVKARPKWDRITQTVIKDQPLEIFGYWQTQDYEPPTAENGLVPRNAYGNVELFKECMLPKKTVHLRLNGLNRICKKLGIDCANAVVGFDFHQGACHPLYDGFIICEEFADTVTAAWHEDQENQVRKEQEKYEARVYGNWKKLIRGLLIRERLKKKYNF